MRTEAGFTLVELVVVIVLMAILAAVAAPRFFGSGDVEGPAFTQELASAARYAQKMAINSGCPVRLAVTATGYALWQPQDAPGPGCGAGFARSVLHPGTGQPFAAATPPGVTIGAPVTVDFTATGAPVGAADQVITVGTQAVIIAARSGYVDVQ